MLIAKDSHRERMRNRVTKTLFAFLLRAVRTRASRALLGRIGNVLGESGACVVAATLLSATIACSPAHSPKGQNASAFRAKVAAGCTTIQECRPIVVEARARFVSCANGPMKTSIERACAAEVEDRTTAERALDQATTAAEKAQDDDSRAAQQQDSLLELQDKAARLNDSCADLKALEVLATTAPNPETAALYQTMAVNKRTEQVRMRTNQIDYHIRQAAPDLRRFEDLSDARSAIADMRTKLDELRCYDVTAAQTIAPRVEDWSVKSEASIQTEESCRATPHCMERRVAEPICTIIDDRRRALESIQRERRNPSGYVNVTFLHDLGEQIQSADEQLRTQQKEFATTTHHTFNANICQPRP
jgi:hypothetical protein